MIALKSFSFFAFLCALCGEKNLMDISLPPNIHYYILLLLFTALFVLQVWMMVKFKEMVRRVLEIYQRVQSAQGYTTSPPQIPPGEIQKICQHCRHRETYPDPAGKSVFVYRCRLNRQSVQLVDSCRKFEFDHQNADI